MFRDTPNPTFGRRRNKSFDEKLRNLQLKVYLVNFIENNLPIRIFLECFKIVYDFCPYSFVWDFSVAINATRESIELTIFIVKLKEFFVKVSCLKFQDLELLGVLCSVDFINVSFV